MNGRAARWFRAFGAYLKGELRPSLVFLALTLAAVILLSALVSRMARQASEGGGDLPADFSVSASLVDEDQSFLGRLVVEYFQDMPYISQLHLDSYEKAMERLANDEVIVVLRLPPDLFEEARTGSQRDPIEFWLNPRMPAESGQIGIIVRQYSASFNYLYGSVFGYQKFYVDLGGDEDESWEKTTAHSFNALASYFGRNRYVATGDLLSFNLLLHVLSGLLLVFASLPAMGVLAATLRTARTPYEDRLLLSGGYGPLMLARLFSGFAWWLVLVLPLLFFLKAGGLLTSILPAALLLLSVFLTASFLMLAVGRIRAPEVTLLQSGWFILFIFFLLGGVLYPPTLFPPWLDRAASLTPAYPVMEGIYRALYLKTSPGMEDLLLAARSLIPAGFLAFIFGRRRVS